LISPSEGSRKPAISRSRRGLAAAGWPEQADQLPMIDPQRDVIDHRKRSKALGQAAQINGRQSCHSLYSRIQFIKNTRAPLQAALFIVGSI